MKHNLEELKKILLSDDWSKVFDWTNNFEGELRELNWAERADAIHWGQLERLRKEILGVE